MATPAAVIVHKEKEIVAIFRAANAINPGAGRSPASLRVHEGLALRRLREREILREDAEGRLYLDEPAWEELRVTRRRLALLVVGIALVLAFLVHKFAGS